MSGDASISKCPRCGTALATGGVEGLCARCLAAFNLDVLTPVDGVADAAADPLPTADELAPFFPPFEIHSCLGRGGMGVVYKARQKSLDRWVALKLLTPELAADPAFARRFAREARLLAALNHPHIVAIHDSGEAGGCFYLIMEYVDGESLRQRLKTKRMTPAEALDIVVAACDALQCAHDRGIVHCDIKPENIMTNRSGTVKIADFGIARMMNEPGGADASPAQAGVRASAHTLFAGTPDYAAPEQLACASTDHRADIYSLGVVLYEMLTGGRPGAGIVEPPSRRAPAVDPGLDAIVLKAVAKEPDQRYATVREFRSRIQQARSALHHPRRNWRRATLWLVIMAVGITLVLTLGRYTALSRLPLRPSGGTLPFADAVDPALRQFQENLAALIKARKEALRLTQEGGSPPAALAAKIADLEARDPVAADAAELWLRQVRPVPVLASPKARAAALRQFEKNLNALYEARKQAFMQTEEDGSPPAALAAKIASLKALDRELRELISKSASLREKDPAPTSGDVPDP